MTGDAAIAEAPAFGSETIDAISSILHVEARSYVAPIWWAIDPTDAATVRHSASCFFLEVGSNRFGITANHVIYGNEGDGTGGYLDDRARHQNARLMVRNTDISDWNGRVIASDRGLDLTTFRVSDAEFAAIGCRPFACAADKWPPQAPDISRGVFIAGCFGGGRRILNRKAVEFAIETNGLVLTGLETDSLEVRVEREHLKPHRGQPIPSMTKDLGGYSGAPLLVVSASLGPLFWPGGVIIRQLRARDEQDSTTLWARRLDCVKPDGHLTTSRYVDDDGSGS